MFDIVCIGNSTQDIFIKNSYFLNNGLNETKNIESFKIGSKIEIENLKILPGGGGANAAVGLAKLGLSVALISRVGQDIFGQQILKNLYKKGVDLKMVQIDKKESSGISIILISKTGERTIFSYRACLKNLTHKLINFEKLKAKWIYLSSTGGNFDFINHIIDFAKSYDIKIAFNPGVLELNQNQKTYKIIKNIDLVLLNQSEAMILLDLKKVNENVIYSKLQNITKSSIVTNNEKGSVYIMKDKVLKIPSFKTKSVDATGAGDAYSVGFLAGILKSEKPETCLKWGVFNAASVIKKIGAQTNLQSAFPADIDLKIDEIKI